MPMFSLFSKKEKEPDFVKSKDTRLKRINLNYLPPQELLPMIDSDISCVEKLTSVNYYAIKEKYIEAFIYYTEDYRKSMLRLVFFVNEKKEQASQYYDLPFKTLSSLFSKIGKYI